ncbi:hypothetical protein NAEGRDRAFT_79286 [Naegleria gruberi]|uniref:Uncharacterized protein n=1 Tax=Naegleria gruberi TaxID=5762 RepID=D2VB92_NAEGR|nr:uncharacterized protein NAEGRDRAFT_79286 [Naegleria gruberi]EFC45868.1 hypothetical protein NAEGRDRAFT_79286 [Naegleria gruberi]|eukprot:XP_002678612.1 hypothetical protein NAEGRDRAFT_79286 [Naegleria gruberi strain NEG-M]
MNNSNKEALNQSVTGRRLGVLARHVFSIPLQTCLNHTQRVVTHQSNNTINRSENRNYRSNNLDWYFGNDLNRGGLKNNERKPEIQSSLNNQFFFKKEQENNFTNSNHQHSEFNPILIPKNHQQVNPSSEKDDEEQDSLLELLSNDRVDQTETKEEFEEKKRKLLILLDQAVEAKMKISKAFPEKLALFGNDLSRYNLNWHPGWREPERFVPEIDCDPYRGACSVSSCACQLFQSWPVGEEGSELYVYNPKIVNPETELCRECHHLKSDHYLATKADRSKYKEFSQENVEKYELQVSEDLPPKHPSETPTHLLSHYYEENPLHPGASPNVNKLKLLEETEENDKKKSMSSMNMDDDFDDDDDPLAEGF